MTVPELKRDDAASDAISAVLRIGVTASLVMIAAGTVLSFAQGGAYGAGPPGVARLIGPGGSFPRTLSWFAAGLMRGDGQAVIVAGLLVLVATPVLRVAVSLLAFAREKDRVFCAITGTVLLLLLLSFVLGKG